MGLCECTERNFTFTSESEDDLRTIMVHRYLRNVKDKKLNKLKEIQEEESIVEEVKPKRAPKPKKRKSKLRQSRKPPEPKPEVHQINFNDYVSETPQELEQIEVVSMKKSVQSSRPKIQAEKLQNPFIVKEFQFQDEARKINLSKQQASQLQILCKKPRFNYSKQYQEFIPKEEEVIIEPINFEKVMKKQPKKQKLRSQLPPEKPAEEPETFKQSFYMQNDYYEPIIPKILPVASAYVHPAAPKETDSDLESSTSKHSEIEHATNVFRLSREHIIRNPAPPLNQNMKLLNLEGRLTIEDEMRASPMRRSLKALDY